MPSSIEEVYFLKQSISEGFFFFLSFLFAVVYLSRCIRLFLSLSWPSTLRAPDNLNFVIIFFSITHLHPLPTSTKNTQLHFLLYYVFIKIYRLSLSLLPLLLRASPVSQAPVARTDEQVRRARRELLDPSRPSTAVSSKLR